MEHTMGTKRMVKSSTKATRIGFLHALIATISDSKAGWWPKVWTLAALFYVLWPMDIVPDLIPVIGWLDDVGVGVAALAYLANQARKYQKRVNSVDVKD